MQIDFPYVPSVDSLRIRLNSTEAQVYSSFFHLVQGDELQSIKTIRVVVADDSPTALRSVCEYLEFAGGFEVVGTASDGLNAIELASARKPDLVLLDLSMPRVNGLEAAEQIRLSSPDLRVIIFSELTGLSIADECRRHGADSFLHKSHLPDRLLPEIERLFSSEDQSCPGPSNS
jgi:DNA-binding NarL/FixJ family response regulator